MSHTSSRRNVTISLALAMATAAWAAAPAAAQDVRAEALTSTASPLARADRLRQGYGESAEALRVKAEALASTAETVRLTLDEAMARAVAASHRVGEGQAR